MRGVGSRSRRSHAQGRSAALFGAFLAFGCTGADWQSFRAEAPYQPPNELHVSIVMRAEGPDSQAVVDEVWETLEGELERRGIHAQYWRGPGTPPPPALFIIVEGWDAGNRFERWLCGSLGGCGEGSTTLFVDLRTPRPALVGRVRGWVRSGVYGGSALNSAEAAGAATGCAVAFGDVTPQKCR
jgi:hypothetical protein